MQSVGRATATTTRRWLSGSRRRNGSGSREHDEHEPASEHSAERFCDRFFGIDMLARLGVGVRLVVRPSRSKNVA